MINPLYQTLLYDVGCKKAISSQMKTVAKCFMFLFDIISENMQWLKY